MIHEGEQLSKMASTKPHSSLPSSFPKEDPNLPSSSSSRPHDETTEEEESPRQLLNESHAEEEHPSSSPQRRSRHRVRRGRPSCSHFNYKLKLNPLSLSPSVYLIILKLYFPYILLLSLVLSPTPVYTRTITAKAIHGPPNVGTLPLTQLTSQRGNVIVSEGGGGGDGREGGGATSRKPETSTAGSDADMEEDLFFEVDFNEMSEDDDLALPHLLGSLDSPPVLNSMRDEDIPLIELIEESGLNYIIEDNPITTMEIMLNNQSNNNRIGQGSDNDRGSASTALPVIHRQPSPSSSASVERVGAPGDAEMSTASGGLSGQTTSPHEQPPHLSPQNMSGTDLSSDSQVSPPQLQQETAGFQGSVFANRNPLSNSPVNFVMVEPRDVVPEVIANHHEYKLTCKGEECQGSQGEAEPIPTSTSNMLSRNTPDSTTGEDPNPASSSLVPSTKNNNRIHGVRGRRRKLKVVLPETRANNNVRQIRNITQHERVITDSGNLENEMSPSFPLQHRVESESSQIPLQSSPPEVPSSSTHKSPTPIIEDAITFESFMDLYGDELGTNVEVALGIDNTKLPAFSEVKKRRLPRSAFQEYKDEAGSTTYIVEGDSGGLISGLNEIDTTGLGSPAKQRNMGKPEMSPQTDLNNFLPQLQNLDADNQEKKHQLPAPAPPTLGETLLQKYLKDGLAGIGITPKVPDPPLSLNTTNSVLPSSSSTSIAQQVASSISAYVASSSTRRLQEILANQIQALAQDDSSIFKVPVPITKMGRPGGKLDQVSPLHMVKRQVPPQMGQQQPWASQMAPFPQRTMSNLNQVSPQYGQFQNYNAGNQYPQSGQMSGAQWNSPNSDLSKLPSYNNYPVQPVQQQPHTMSYHKQRSSFNAQQPQYAVPGAPMPSPSPSPVPPSAESFAQQQQRLFRPQPQRPSLAQNLNQYSTAGSSMQSPSSYQSPPLSPSGFPRQQMPIYGQSQTKPQMVEPNMRPYESQPGRMPSQSPSPMYPLPGSGPHQQQVFNSPTNSMNPQTGVMSYPYGKQGLPYQGEGNLQGPYGNVDTQKRYNLALQFQRQMDHQQLQLQQSPQQQYYNNPRMHSMGYDPNILSGMQQRNENQQYRQAYPPPYNKASQGGGGQMNQAAWQGQMVNPNGMGGLIPDRRTPMPGSVGLFPDRRTPMPGMGGLVPGRGTPMPGMGGLYPDTRTPMPGVGALYSDRRTPMPSSGFQYPPEVISGGEAALYRARMNGVPQSRQLPAAAGSFGNRWPGVDTASHPSPIFNPAGAGTPFGQGVSNANDYNKLGREGQNMQMGNSGINHGGAYTQPSARMPLQPQQAPAPQNPETSGPVANTQPLVGQSQSSHQSQSHPHQLPHQGRSMPFYSQSDVDAHHSRVTGNNQTRKDIEFENESKALNWYLNEAKQKLHHNPVSTTNRPSSVLPADPHSLGHHHAATPAPAAPHSMSHGGSANRNI